MTILPELFEEVAAVLALGAEVPAYRILSNQINSADWVKIANWGAELSEAPEKYASVLYLHRAYIKRNWSITEGDLEDRFKQFFQLLMYFGENKINFYVMWDIGRALSRAAGIPFAALWNGALKHSEWETLIACIDELKESAELFNEYYHMVATREPAEINHTEQLDAFFKLINKANENYHLRKSSKSDTLCPT